MNRTIKWDITSKCGLRCKHCYNSKYFTDSQVFEPSIIDVLKAMDSFVKMGVTRIHFLGGEPLMSLALYPALECAKNKGIVATITTNGMLLKAEMASLLFALNVSIIAVSLDGISADTNDAIRGKGVFNQVVTNLQQAIKMRERCNSSAKIYITMTLTKQNAYQAERILKFADEIGVDGVLVAKLDREGNANSHWDELALSAEDWIDSVEAIVSQKHLYPDIYLEVVCKKKLAEYLLIKYNWRNSVLDKETDYCNGTDEEYYVRADGLVWPCRKASEEGCASIQLENGCDNKLVPNIYITASEDVLTNKYLLNFTRFSRDITKSPKAPFCESCKFVFVCKPCPLDRRKNYISDECKEVRIRMKKYLTWVCSQKLKLADGCFYVTLNPELTSLVRIDTQDTVQLEGLGKEIVDKISERDYGINEIIDALFVDYKESIEFDEFAADVKEFVLDLQVNGLVSFWH